MLYFPKFHLFAQLINVFLQLVIPFRHSQIHPYDARDAGQEREIREEGLHLLGRQGPGE